MDRLSAPVVCLTCTCPSYLPNVWKKLSALFISLWSQLLTANGKIMCAKLEAMLEPNSLKNLSGVNHPLFVSRQLPQWQLPSFSNTVDDSHAFTQSDQWSDNHRKFDIPKPESQHSEDFAQCVMAWFSSHCMSKSNNVKCQKYMTPPAGPQQVPSCRYAQQSHWFWSIHLPRVYDYMLRWEPWLLLAPPVPIQMSSRGVHWMYDYDSLVLPLFLKNRTVNTRSS